MSTRIPPPAELRERGFRALVKELGYADAIRFFWQYESGRGDYTEERRSLLPAWSAQDLAREEERLLERRRLESEASG